MKSSFLVKNINTQQENLLGKAATPATTGHRRLGLSLTGRAGQKPGPWAGPTSGTGVLTRKAAERRAGRAAERSPATKEQAMLP